MDMEINSNRTRDTTFRELSSAELVHVNGGNLFKAVKFVATVLVNIITHPNGTNKDPNEK
jgi:hypothetical protein